MDAKVIEQFAHVLRLSVGPLEIGRVELDVLVAHLGDGTHCAFRIDLQCIANGIKL